MPASIFQGTGGGVNNELPAIWRIVICRRVDIADDTVAGIKGPIARVEVVDVEEAVSGASPAPVEVEQVVFIVAVTNEAMPPSFIGIT